MKAKVIYVVKMLIGLTLVGTLLWRVDGSKVARYAVHLTPSTILLVLLLSTISLLVQFLRWRYLVSSNSADFRVKDLAPSFFGGFFFRMIVPGGHIEAGKIFLMPGRKRGKAIAFGMEKFFQTYVKVLLIAIALPLSFPRYRLLCIPVVTALLAVYIAVPFIRKLKELQETERNNHAVFVKTLGYSFAVFVLIALQYFVLLKQHASIGLFETAHAVVYLYGASVLPISVSGLGIRELLAVYFLPKYDVALEHALAASLFMFVLGNVVPALVGAVVVYRKRVHLKEIKTFALTAWTFMQSIWKGKNGGDRIKAIDPEP